MGFLFGLGRLAKQDEDDDEGGVDVPVMWPLQLVQLPLMGRRWDEKRDCECEIGGLVNDGMGVDDDDEEKAEEEDEA